ncbi:MAG TPA: hypothetical protein EYM84_05355 [Flavobacteriales bacterium]|nr:hypothetical protein [Flavobacteriales bacterium]HIN39680.1 hypothetical protein [Flavobacteriales bacterium]
MKFGFFTISTFDLIPLCKHITDHVCLLSDENSVDMVQCQVANTLEYHNKVRKISIGEFAGRTDVRLQSFQFKIAKYFKLIYQMIRFQIKNRSAICYTVDLPTLNIFLLIRSLFFFNRNYVIYHQFEILEPDAYTAYDRFNLALFKMMKKRLDLFICPEANRIEYFIEISGKATYRTYLFPNTTTPTHWVADTHISNDKTITIAHIGTAVGGHYTQQFLEVISDLDGIRDYKVQFIGYLPTEVKNLVQSYNLPHLELIDDLPHKKLQEYYGKIDIGIILYKDLGINYKYCAPNKLYEYWANGIYVIAHPLDGLVSIFADDKLGKLCDMDNEAEFKNAVLSAMEEWDNNTRVQIMAIFEEKYSIKRYFEGLSRILSEQFIN